MEAAFQAIAEPNRRRILELLGESDELSSGEIATHFHLTAPAISQHLGVLEQAQLVAIRRDGTRRLYRLRAEGFQELSSFLERFWAHGLARLKTAAEMESGRRHRSRIETGRSHALGQPRQRRRRRARDLDRR